MRTFVIFFVSLFSFMVSYAQNETSYTKTANDPWKISLNAHYTTQHYWRGIGRGGLFGKAPAFEPSITFSNKKWRIGVFAGASMDDIYKTVMPFVVYNVTPQLV